MPTNRLTDAELALVGRYVEVGQMPPLSVEDVGRLHDEVKERRVADLTAAERSALSLLTKRIPEVIDCCPRHDEQYVLALAVLDKLLKETR